MCVLAGGEGGCSRENNKCAGQDKSGIGIRAVKKNRIMAEEEPILHYLFPCL